MPKTDLQREFHQLITEISKEVLELSVTKTMEKSANSMKENVPAITNNVEQLRRALENLHAVNSELTKHQVDLNKREQRVDHQLKNIVQKIEKDLHLSNDVQESMNSFRVETERRFDLQENVVQSVKDAADQHSDSLSTQVNELHELTEGGVLTGEKSNKLLIWSFVFSLGSFGIMFTLLLFTLGVISV
jgi:exonuclease VII large subunit